MDRNDMRCMYSLIFKSYKLFDLPIPRFLSNIDYILIAEYFTHE